MLLLAGGGAFLATRGEGPGILGFGDPEPATPRFNFNVIDVALRTTTLTPLKQLEEKAESVADDVAHQLDILYSGGFVDPGVWEDGDFEDLFDSVMDGGAAAQAAKSIDTLTLGLGAAAIYDFVEPNIGRAQISVLTGTDDQPVEAIAQVFFAATAEHDDGTFTKVVSEGTFYFKNIDGKWRIFSFDVTRNEKAAEGPVTPTATVSAEATP